ncbi:GNAT family N-acetyltransferase [Nocardia sp. CA-128927]|uniref:GNAT family N-acetyltransferase n=1 Tax=Nocardia sp. CA-128927 TaxID=3239975 RepID=UPI003D99AC0E
MPKPTVAEHEIEFRRITEKTVLAVCELSETLTPEQRGIVADNGVSIAQAHFSESAWFRAIYADDTLEGFVMVHLGIDDGDEIDCPGAYLWRLMIAGPQQRHGIGRKAVLALVNHLKARGLNALYVSYGQGPGSPESFYKSLGFISTGEYYGNGGDLEVEVVLRWSTP